MSVSKEGSSKVGDCSCSLLTLGNAEGEETLLLCLNVEAHLARARIVQREAARSGLVDATVAELDAVFGH